MARQDGAQDCREHGDASAVVEKTLAVEDRLEPGRRPQPAEEAHDRYRVGGGDDRAEQEPTRPIEAEAEVDEHRDHDDRQKHADCGEQADRQDSPPQLLEVER